MERRDFMKAITGAMVASALPQDALGQAAGGQRRRPNLIVILADDLGYGEVGCYGSRRIRTPQLDALAAGGVRFTDFHSSGAVCSPTRAGLMTGRYQQRAGIPGVITAARHRHHGLATTEITFARLLKAAGYATGIFGKWHLGYQPRFNPTRHGFDVFRGYVSGNVDYVSHVDQTGVADWWDGATQITEEGYTTHLITRHAVRFIEANRARPFCLYIAHEAPHYPYQAPGDPAIRSVGRARVRRRVADIAATYARMVEEMDTGIGQVMAAVRRLGLERQTFVFFFSDNGACRHGSNAPWRGFKGSLWEGGHRVPAIAYWPGRIAAGRTSEATTICLDLFPTFLAIGGASTPEGHQIDGVDLLPHLSAGRPIADRTLFWAHARQRAVRQGPWKLLLDGRRGDPALYNLRDDPAERHNLATQHPQRAETMRAALRAWERDVNRQRRTP